MLTEKDLHNEHALLERLQQHWLIGKSSALTSQDIPNSWQSMINALPTERRAIATLALASQFQHTVFIPQKPKQLTVFPDIPPLSKPTLPNELRPAFRRLMEVIKKNTNIPIANVLRLLETKGFVPNPVDWLPAKNDDTLPSIYTPWLQWVDNKKTTPTEHETDTLTQENWDEWYPAQRLTQLKNLRMSAPAATRQLIERCATREAADKRLKIIAVLAIRLSPEDIPYLQQLSQDRSKKIIALAHQLLARLDVLNINTASKENTAELIAYYEFKKIGIFKKGRRLTPKKLQNKKQQATRSELLAHIPLTQFAHALGIQTDELIASWVFDKNRYHDNIAFISNAANSVSDENIARLLDRLIVSTETDIDVISLVQPLSSRLTFQQKKHLVLSLCEHNSDATFFAYLPYVDRTITELDWPTIAKSIPWKNLQKQLTKELNERGYIHHSHLAHELYALGLLVTSDVANRLLSELVALGFLHADPAAHFLKFNAALSAYPNENQRT